MWVDDGSVSAVRALVEHGADVDVEWSSRKAVETLLCACERSAAAVAVAATRERRWDSVPAGSYPLLGAALSDVMDLGGPGAARELVRRLKPQQRATLEAAATALARTDLPRDVAGLVLLKCARV
jgi:hypothetical protein